MLDKQIQKALLLELFHFLADIELRNARCLCMSKRQQQQQPQNANDIHLSLSALDDEVVGTEKKYEKRNCCRESLLK